MFGLYDQNNSGGSFTICDEVAEYVFVEGMDQADIDRRAQDKGIYFDGCDTGQDCPCCGNRWSRVYETFEGPQIYGQVLDKFFETKRCAWAHAGEPYVIIHYLNGKTKIYDPAGRVVRKRKWNLVR